MRARVCRARGPSAQRPVRKIAELHTIAREDDGAAAWCLLEALGRANIESDAEQARAVVGVLQVIYIERELTAIRKTLQAALKKD